MPDFPRYTNWTYQIELTTGGPEETERVVNHARSYGHHVHLVSDRSVVFIGSGKVFGMCERDFPDMPVDYTMLSQPVGYETGEWIVCPRIGIVGKAAWEYGHKTTSGRTSVNFHVGDATWCASTELVVKLSDLPIDVQAELVSIGERQAADWERLHGGKDDPTMRPDRERANELARDALKLTK